MGLLAEGLGRLWKFGAPLFVSVLILAVSLRWIVTGRSSRREHVCVLLLGGIAVSGLPFCYVEYAILPSSFAEWFLVLSPAVLLAAGTYLLYRNRRAGVPASLTPIGALEVVFTATAAYGLIGFRVSWQIGAYFVLAAALVYAIHLLAVSFAVWRTRATR
jgi:hypothetical protein